MYFFQCFLIRDNNKANIKCNYKNNLLYFQCNFSLVLKTVLIFVWNPMIVLENNYNKGLNKGTFYFYNNVFNSVKYG